MSSSNPAPEDAYKQIEKATGQFYEKITPWLLEVGSWIFGGLIAFNLIIMGALMTVGPVDRAITLAAAAFALVLPLDVAGLFVLRLSRDLEHVGIEVDFENEVRQAMLSAVPTLGETAAAPKTIETVRKRRTGVALSYAFGILTLSGLLTLAGMMAALWHMAWWIAAGFAAMVLISLVLVSVAVVTSDPPESAEQRARMRRYGQELARQAKEQARQDKERLGG